MKHIKETLQQTKDEAYRTHEKNNARFEALMKRIDEAETAQPTTQTQINTVEKIPLLQMLRHWFLGAGQPQLRYAGWLLGAVLLIQSGYIAYQQQKWGDVVSYQTASGGEPSVTNRAESVRYMIVFQSDTTMAVVGQLLQANNAQMISGPQDANAYTVSFVQPLNTEQQRLFEAHEAVVFFEQQD